MYNTPVPRFWIYSALTALACCAAIAVSPDSRVTDGAGYAVMLRAQSTGGAMQFKFHQPGQPRQQERTAAQQPTSKTFQKISADKGVIKAEYGFANFNGDPLQIYFSIPQKDLASYKQGYGYSDTELKDIEDRRKQAYQEAYQRAVREHLSQAQYDKNIAAMDFDFKAKRQMLLITRGFTILPGNVLMADIPQIVKRNTANLKNVALALNKIAGERGYGPQEIITAALSFTQTAIQYSVPPEIDGSGRHTGGIFPPLETISIGRGDCDTKSAMLASILSNWSGIKLIGVSVPGHYLMGILQSPGKGDLFVEYNGNKYVLLEPAGPAWLPPGMVGRHTTELLAGNDYHFELLN